MEKKRKTLGEQLRRSRAISRLTLRQVEEAIQISNAYLSQLENDKIKKPSANVLYKLACLYKVDLNVFLFACGIIKEEPSGNILPKIKMNGPQELTKEEEQALIDYLGYLRWRKRP